MGWTTKFRFTAKTKNFVFLHSVYVGFEISQLPIRKLSPLKCLECKTNCLFFFWRNSPQWARGYSFTRFLDHTHTPTRHSRKDSSGRVISSSQRPLPDNTQHSQQTDIHDSVRIWTHNLSRRVAAYLHLRQRGHWDRRFHLLPNLKMLTNVLTASCTTA